MAHESGVSGARDAPPSLLASWNILLTVLMKYGPVGAIAAYLIWHITFTQDLALRQTLALLQEHIYESHYTQRALCINTAVLAGTPQTLCDVPQRTP